MDAFQASAAHDAWALSLTDAMNTYNPALVVLQDRGYNLYFVPDERPEFFGDYWAIKERRVFSAQDPLRLLGLVALWDCDGDDWQGRERADVLTPVENYGFAKNDFVDMTDDDFVRLLAHLHPLFAFFRASVPSTPTRAEVARLVRSLAHEEETDYDDNSDT